MSSTTFLTAGGALTGTAAGMHLANYLVTFAAAWAVAGCDYSDFPQTAAIRQVQENCFRNATQTDDFQTLLSGITVSTIVAGAVVGYSAGVVIDHLATKFFHLNKSLITR